MRTLVLACWSALFSVVISFPTTSKSSVSVAQPDSIASLQENQKGPDTIRVAGEVKKVQERLLESSERSSDGLAVEHASKLPLGGVTTAPPNTQTRTEASVTHVTKSVKVVSTDGTPPSPKDQAEFVTEVATSTFATMETTPEATLEDLLRNQTVATLQNETKPEQPVIPLSGIVDDEKDFGAVNDAVEIVKDVTTLLSKEEKNDQKREPANTDIEPKKDPKAEPQKPTLQDENETDDEKTVMTPSVPGEEDKLESAPDSSFVSPTKKTVNANVKNQRSIMIARSPTKNSRGTPAMMDAASLNLGGKLPKLHKINKREEASDTSGSGVTDRGVPVRTEVVEPEVAKPEVAEPEAAKPEATESEVAKLESAKPEVAQTENTVRGETDPEVPKPEASEDKLVQSNDVSPKVTMPQVPKPELAKPEVAEAETNKPEVNKPEVNKPEATEPEASKQETVEPGSETAQSEPPYPETHQTEAPHSESVPPKVLGADIGPPDTVRPSEVQSEVPQPGAGQQQFVAVSPATAIPDVPAKTKDTVSETTQDAAAGSAPQTVANQTSSAVSTDEVTGVKNTTASGGGGGFDPFSAIRAIARPVINVVTSVRDQIRPVFGAALSPIVGPNNPSKGDEETAQKAQATTQPSFQGTELPGEVTTKQPNRQDAESSQEVTMLPDKQRESVATTTAGPEIDQMLAEPKNVEGAFSNSETALPTGEATKNESQTLAGLPGLPFDPTATIKRIAQPAIDAATAVRDAVRPVFDAAIAPVVDAISPGKESGEVNQTLVSNVEKQKEKNWEATPSVAETSEEPEKITEGTANVSDTFPKAEKPSATVASSTKTPKEPEKITEGTASSAEAPKLPKKTYEDKSNATETPKEPGKRLYSNYKLFTTFVGNDTAALAAVLALQDIPEVDFWNIPTLNRNATFLVPPDLVDRVTEDLTKAGLKLYVLTNDIQSWLDREREENKPGVFLEQRDISNFAYDKYHRVEEITGYMDLLAQKYSNIATVRSIGMTQEGRPIKGVILSTGANRPVIWLDGGIHAREWIAPASLVYFLGKMTSGYGSDSTITGLMQAFDFYVFPVINPDGYAYTFHADRLWRKNRSGGKHGCRGVDPNRNFASSFGGPGTSSHPCSDIYRGSAAFSETESRAIRDALLGLGSRAKAYVTVHSYSQLIMVPYGNGRGTYTKDYADQIAAARAISRAIQVKSGVYYQVGTVSSLLGTAAGSATDWVYDSANIKYSLAVELRDKGRFGFLLPNFLIVPTAEEISEGFKALGKFIARRELNKTIQ